MFLSDPDSLPEILKRAGSGSYNEYFLPFFEKDAFPKDFVASVKTGLVSSAVYPFQSRLVVWLHSSVFPTLMPVIESAFSDQVCQGCIGLELPFVMLIVIVVDLTDTVRRLEIWGGKSFCFLRALFPQLVDVDLASVQNGAALCLDTLHPGHTKNVIRSCVSEEGEKEMDVEDITETERSPASAPGHSTAPALNVDDP